MNYFSIGFRYEHARRGFGGGGVHVLLAVNEQEESRKLTQAWREACQVFDKLKIEHRTEYAYPDGSLFFNVRTDYSYADLYFLIGVSTKMPIELWYEDEMAPQAWLGGITLEQKFEEARCP